MPTETIEQKRRRRDDELLLLLAFWESHVPAVYAGLIALDGWMWDEQAQTYTSDHGTRLAEDDLRHISLMLAVSVGDANRATTAAYEAGDLTAAQWHGTVANNIANEYLSQGALAAGGVARLTPGDIAIVAGTPTQGTMPTASTPSDAPPCKPGSGVADALSRLDKLADGLDDGSVSFKAAANRVDQYADGGYAVNQAVTRESHKHVVDDKGELVYQFKRSYLDPGAEHCRNGEFTLGCTTIAAQGWKRIGALPPPGSLERTCGTRCRCWFAWATDEYTRLLHVF